MAAPLVTTPMAAAVVTVSPVMSVAMAAPPVMSVASVAIAVIRPMLAMRGQMVVQYTGHQATGVRKAVAGTAGIGRRTRKQRGCDDRGKESCFLHDRFLSSNCAYSA